MTKDISRRGLLGYAGASIAATQLKAFQATPITTADSVMTDSDFVAIPAGEFIMGFAGGQPDERAEHKVRITRGFELGKFEVTQAQWETVMTDAHSKPGAPRPTPLGAKVSSTPSHFKEMSRPVEKVSWDDIQVFLRRLNARERKHEYRLPTEAEWEYAAKAGRPEPDAEALSAMAWNKSNSEEQTHPVGTKKPNAWGLYDMHGNVSEWVLDWYAPEYTDPAALAVDPKGPLTGSFRIFRGGCWFDSDADCRTTHRRHDFPISRFYNVGFRVVRALK